jgi:flagellar hook protein FlgE
MSMGTALTGLAASTTRLEVIANNIANSSTTGFKTSQANFAELISPGSAVGTGVKLFGLSHDLGQGALNNTGAPLDMAISGSGYFRLSDNGAIVYSRAGNFVADKDGFIVNNAGHGLTGYQADSNGNLTGALSPLQISTADIPPTVTSTADVGVNLDAAATPPATAPFDPDNPDTFNFTTSLSIYDTQGGAHTLTLYYVKGAGANAWDVQASVDGTDPAHVTIPATALAFNTDGTVDAAATPQPMALSIDLAAVAAELGRTNGAAVPLDMTVDFSRSTQYGGGFATSSVSQDGNTNGRLSGIEVDASGVISGRYSNGRSQPLGQVALANFGAPQALAGIGDTEFAETYGSGPAMVGAPGSGSLGMVTSGALEASNVELTDELVKMIEAQRSYQANAQVISTADTMAQTIINLR